MDEDSRLRLKAAIAISGKTSKAISLELGWPETYVSRVVSGKIRSPDPSRLLRICELAGTSIGYILTGERVQEEREALIGDLANAPSDVIEKVAEFVRKQGITPSK